MNCMHKELDFFSNPTTSTPLPDEGEIIPVESVRSSPFTPLNYSEHTEIRKG